jgi:starvation-inducible outer membrane lipoprotein
MKFKLFSGLVACSMCLMLGCGGSIPTAPAGKTPPTQAEISKMQQEAQAAAKEAAMGARKKK